jgi:hypothetical protein
MTCDSGSRPEGRDVKQARGASPAERREAHRPKPKDINAMPLDNKQIPTDAIAKERADWLLDAVACATQDRRFLRGDPEYDEVLGEAILLNGEKAIHTALSRPSPTEQQDSDGLAERLLAIADINHERGHEVAASYLREAANRIEAMKLQLRDMREALCGAKANLQSANVLIECLTGRCSIAIETNIEHISKALGKA